MADDQREAPTSGFARSEPGKVSLVGTRRAPRIGYVPTSQSLQRPGDRRRFVHYAHTRNLPFEIANPDEAYDLVVVTQMADLGVWSRYDKGKVVYDAIDSYLAIPRTNLKGMLRGLAKAVAGHNRYFELDFWKAIGTMCRRADAVICSTEEQRRDISRFSDNIHIILDVHASVIHDVKRDYGLHDPVRLVWEGVPQTLPSLVEIKPVIDALGAERPVELHLVTDTRYYRYLQAYGLTDTLTTVRKIFSNVVLHEWREDTCAGVIASCDIAVIPLDMRDPFARGKPENKLLLLWRMGMPVVASATPAYSRAMSAAGISAACADTQAWLSTLRAFIADDSLREEAAARGRAYAETHFSEGNILAMWDRAFASIGFDFAPASGGGPAE